MSNEISAILSVNYEKGGAKTQISENIQITQTGDSFTEGVQEIGTSEEEIAQGADVGTPGFLFVKNLDDTNYVEVGSTTGVYDHKLLPGQWAWYHHNSATIYAKANTGACNVFYCIFEL